MPVWCGEQSRWRCLDGVSVYWPGAREERDLSGTGGWIDGNRVEAAEATANASRPAGFQIEVLTSAAGDTTDRGRTKITRVPEPSSGATRALGGVPAPLAARRCVPGGSVVPLARRASVSRQVPRPHNPQ